jgi:hypothetical protein
MADKLDNSAPFDDDQGTRIEQEPTGAGAEASEGIRDKPEQAKSQDHWSGYGGKAGTPKQSNDGSDAEE